MTEIVSALALPRRVVPNGFEPFLEHYGDVAVCVDSIESFGDGEACGRMRVQPGDMLHPFDPTRIIEAAAQTGVPAVSEAMSKRRRADTYIPFFEGPFRGIIWDYPKVDDDLELEVILDELEGTRGMATMWVYRDRRPLLMHQFNFGVVTKRVFFTTTKCANAQSELVKVESGGALFDCGYPISAADASVMERTIRNTDAPGHFPEPLSYMVPKYALLGRGLVGISYAADCAEPGTAARAYGLYSGTVSGKIMAGERTRQVTSFSLFDLKAKKGVASTIISVGSTPRFSMTTEVRLISHEEFAVERPFRQVVGLPEDVCDRQTKSVPAEEAVAVVA